jgi:chloramphenicol O-acetyltransferase type A
MNTFNRINLTQWDRREHFEHFTRNMSCSYSITVDIDITALQSALAARHLRAYPTQIYMLASVVNRFTQFRMDTDKEGHPGIWETTHPSYTVLNRARDTFSSIWTPYNAHFPTFYAAASEDIDNYSNSTSFYPQPHMPKNIFDISSIPWLSFTAFNLNVSGNGNHLPPIFTIGKYKQKDGVTLMPFALQVHHGACDGVHVGRFVEALQTMTTNWESWVDSPTSTHPHHSG